MGHSILKLGDASAIVHDSELSLIIGMMVEATHAAPARYPLVSPLVKKADDNRPSSGPGTLDLELDLLISSTDAREEFHALIDSVRKRVESFGPAIPVATVTQLERRVGVSYGSDYPTHYLIGALAQLDVLVHRRVSK